MPFKLIYDGCRHTTSKTNLNPADLCDRRLRNLIFVNTFWPHPCWECVLKNPPKAHVNVRKSYSFSDRLTSLQLPVFMCQIIDTLKVAMFQYSVWKKALSYYICHKSAQRGLPHLKSPSGLNDSSGGRFFWFCWCSNVREQLGEFIFLEGQL